jgi:hypothetical protein
MTHVMCNPWKMTFTLVPMAPLTMISFAYDIHPNYDGSEGLINYVHVHEMSRIVTFMCGMFTFYLRINQSMEVICKVYTNLCGPKVRWKVHNFF